ncbi:MAG: riboflavin biosynthesis protein RibF [Candidatus Omnitrophica bacterium]|nr:riboflavin biosynthesis protein RibF [Candidatus Omnitrophota bacterium]
MKIIYGVKQIKKLRRPVVALGVFDGLHLGHRNILRATVKKAKRIKGTSLVLTFFPHPQEKESLYSLQHRLRLIAEMGVDVCIVVKFSRSFAKISAKDFISEILAGNIGASFIYVGKNFRFGSQAAGDYRLLVKEAKNYKIGVRIFDVVKSGTLTVSSTTIRKLIKNSKLKQAQKLLGRRVSVLGTVIRGSKLGRLLGFPTANINPHHEVVPPAGIYAVQVIFSKKRYDGVCYIGKRPTIYPADAAMRIEVHIFDFHKDIYGKVLEIQFIKLIRSDQKFTSLKDLSAQIKKDIISCRKIL